MIKSYVLPKVTLQISNFDTNVDFEILHTRDIKNVSHAFDISESAMYILHILLFTDIKTTISWEKLLDFFGSFLAVLY